MNLSRAITRVLSSHCCRSNKWLSLRDSPFAAVQLASLSADYVAPAKRTYRRTAKPNPESDPTRPVAMSPTFASSEEESLKLRRPSEIPFQPKVANQVHLIGTVGVPVQLQVLPNGTYAAVSVLGCEKSKGFPQFWYALLFNGSGTKQEDGQWCLYWSTISDLGSRLPQQGDCHRIPVIFQGDLAQVAGSHLKENDVIYVTGQLSGDAPPHAIEDSRVNIQV
ncbi:hypothetical protein B296_00021385 [Ensete ventricosum]|uniref:Uncharacterized protein n=1 Tax=Ensete ventricosum TaxID=4639 RepID=A0A427B088_ENSVE|nr:hypothetical protein B296_00021385 [Ensete ventricosum]